jgi:hypothetical protein
MNGVRIFVQLIAALGLTLVVSVAIAEDPPAESGQRDRIELDASSIKGNQELPKVLYIVPWKDSDIGDLTGRPANSLLDEILAPLDREVFRRQVRYFDQLHASDDSAATEQE